MKWMFFCIPARQPGQAGEEMNRFCASRQVVSVDKEFVPDGANSFWSVCVGYRRSGAVATPGKTGIKNKVDYKEVLNEADFAVYASLRELRKQIAAKEGVPAYALFTNEQLSQMVVNRVSSLAQLGRIDGIGRARLEKYGEAFIRLLFGQYNQGHGMPQENQL